MYKIKLEKDGEVMLESESFAAIVLEKDGEFFYSRSLVSTRHLDVHSVMIMASGATVVMGDLLKELAGRFGFGLLFETEEIDKGGEDDGNNRTP